MDLDTLILRLQELRNQYGNETILVDAGVFGLCDISEVDMGGSDEGVVIWVESTELYR